MSNSTSAANSNRRMSAAWKTQPDEDAQFKAEVFKEHIPNEDEEWMKFEMTKLSQFTRIFPPLPKSMMTNYIEAIKGHVSMHQVPDIAVPVRDKSSPIGTENNENEDEEDNKEEEDDDENNNGNTANANSNSVANSNSDSGKKKSASYEEIIYQVFLQDRRQTMRLRCPLPNRAKADENSSGNFLPPLDAPSSSRSSMSSIGSGRGVVGWKAPPKPQQKEAPKQPTVSQLESAKRLSQGLSVASVAEKAKQGMTSSSSVESHNIVLDPVDYSVNPNGLYTDSAWTSTKANRCVSFVVIILTVEFVFLYG
ncbi:hypothetical protein EON65_25245 [archaeon]|nr:MAG: hypothetical protein EON65_25245 [archaeon]